MNRAEKKNIIDSYARLKKQADDRAKAVKESGIPCFYIGLSTCGRAAGADEAEKALEDALAEKNIIASIIPVGCLGHCYAEPVVIVHNPGFPPICYYNVTPGKARLLVNAFIEKGDPLFEHILGAMEENDTIPCVMDLPRFNMEKRIILEQCGLINPEDIFQYIAAGGYSALAHALVMHGDKIIDAVKASGLKGRGGAGFPAGVKWETARNAAGKDKIVICNADEGDPGAYMDRAVLESNPHQMLEGLAICSLAVGASRAVIYIRSEYPLAVQIVRTAVAQAAALNLIGENILGSGRNLMVDIFQGSGAFVCGEETALIKSIEGKRGTPVFRPPYPAVQGLLGRPTVINNVKTLSLVPHIILNPDKWINESAEGFSTGTVIFSIVGNVVHTGLVEIPAGVTIRTLIFDICGGIPGGKKFKAVQIGGPSGGCLCDEDLDTPVDFDSLSQAGAMMGSGGMVVMDEDTCMVDVARYFLEFTQNESCGKCTFCRIGTKHLLNILNRLTRGEGKEGDIELLGTLSEDIKDGSLCGLGRTAPNPVLTSLRYFRDEYEAHQNEKRCPAMRCRHLTAFYIDPDKCSRACDACVGSCPTEAIFMTKDRKKAIDQTLCVKCGECLTACPPEYNAVRKISPAHLVPVVERPLEEIKEDMAGKND